MWYLLNVTEVKLHFVASIKLVWFASCVSLSYDYINMVHHRDKLTSELIHYKPTFMISIIQMIPARQVHTFRCVYLRPCAPA